MAVVLGAIAGTASAHAASFDCADAKSKVEYLICSDPALSKLDDDLYDRYPSTLETARDPAALIRDERAWLAHRNRCADAACLSHAYRERIAALAKVPMAGWRAYHDAALGISFDYLGNRQVKACPKEHGPHCIALTGRSMPFSQYLIAFHVAAMPLDKAAQDSAIFDKQDNKWIANAGPGAPVNAEPIAGRGWTGIKATITCGISDDLGFHAAAGECLWAVISNGKRSVVADTQGIVGTDANTLRSLNSLRFDR